MQDALRTVLLFATFCCGAAARGTQEVYVWQRAWSTEVTAALRGFRSQIDGCCVLAAEIVWRDNQPQIARPPVDYATLAGLGRPVGLALRIGPYGGTLDSDSDALRAVVSLTRECLANAQSAGLVPAELQVDFDCPESKLMGYRSWLLAMRAGAGKTRLVFTALPAWLRHSEFGALAHAADGFVLQVHSLEKPAGPDTPFSLCDPERAVSWARQASNFGTPFRIALPTYGYELAFDATGKFLALAAEAAHPAWPHDAKRRVVRADPLAMARLAKRLLSDPPPNCSGLIWFRLPVEGDRLNWDRITLEAILRGDIPRAHLEVRVDWPEPTLAEVALINSGQTTEPLPAVVNLSRSPKVVLLAADGLGGFRLELKDGAIHGVVRAEEVPPDAVLAPGRSTKIAWLRFAHETILDVALPVSP